MKYRDMWTAIIIAIFFGVFLALEYTGNYIGVFKLSNLIPQLSGSKGFRPSWTEMVSLALRFLPGNVLLNFLGIKIYRHFCTASVYVFTRYTKKVRWYLREIIAVAVTCLFFLIVLVASVIAFILIRYDLKFDMAGLQLSLYHIAIHALWLFSMTLLVNIFFILGGSEFAFGIIIGIQSVFLACLHFAFNALENASGSWLYQTMLAVNPISHLIIGWHSVGELKDSVLYMIILALIVTIVGAILVHRKDLILNDIEEGN
jgi:hypothetical protein